MSRKGRKLGASLKPKMALAAVWGNKTTAQLGSEFGGHTSQVIAWKKRLTEGVTELLAEVIRNLSTQSMHRQAVTEEFPLLRTLHVVARHRRALADALTARRERLRTQIEGAR